MICMKKIVIFLICFILFFSSTVISDYDTVSAATEKNVILSALKKNRIKYVKSDFNYNFKSNVDWGFERMVGYGKKRNLKLAKKCKFYAIDYVQGADVYKRVSKQNFRKLMRSYNFSRVYFTGFTKDGQFIEVPYYYGFICKVVIRNRKVVKIEPVKKSL